jgi:hypothetical protein
MIQATTSSGPVGRPGRATDTAGFKDDAGSRGDDSYPEEPAFRPDRCRASEETRHRPPIRRKAAIPDTLACLAESVANFSRLGKKNCSIHERFR